jgi:hypothetical protein
MKMSSVETSSRKTNAVDGSNSSIDYNKEKKSWEAYYFLCVNI